MQIRMCELMNSKHRDQATKHLSLSCQISPFRKHNAPVIIFVLPHKISLVTELSFNVVMDNWYQQERLPRNKDRMQATRNTARKPLIVLSASGNMSQEPSRCSSAMAMPNKLHVRRRVGSLSASRRCDMTTCLRAHSTISFISPTELGLKPVNEC